MHDLILFAKALSDPTRIRILAALMKGELCVCELCDAMEISQSTLSTHLQVIRQAQLVNARKEGKWIYYEINAAQRGLINTLFKEHAAVLGVDKRLQRDSERIDKRLVLRKDGVCIIGFEQVDASAPTNQKGNDAL